MTITIATLIMLTTIPLAGSVSTAVLRAREHRQVRTLHRVTGTVRFFENHPWLLKYGPTRQRTVAHRELHRARVWVPIVRRELAETRAALAPPRYDWVALQIAAANVIGRESAGDPWPNCPDPFDGGGSWSDTVACENNGNWMDSPGYYRCGLQFDPSWENRFGRLCP